MAGEDATRLERRWALLEDSYHVQIATRGEVFRDTNGRELVREAERVRGEIDGED